jgi:hypothetical protein
MRHNWDWKTNIRVTVRDLEGKVLEVKEFHNLITTVGLNMFRDLLEGLISDGEIKYLAWGSDNTPPALGNAILGSETARKLITSMSEPGDGQLLTITYIAPGDAIAPPNIEEFGWFAGVGAGGGADTGIMVSRVLYSRAKTALESIQVERVDQIVEA